MNKILAVIIILICSAASVLSQESSTFYDAPLGGGIGYTAGWVIPNVDEINVQLKNINFPNLPKGGFYNSGVSGFIYLGILPNFRIGGYGFGGSRSVSGEYPELFLPVDIMPNGSERRETIYTLNGAGISFEYTLPFVKDIAISIGTSIGRGSLKLELSKNYGSLQWGSFWQNAQFNFPIASTSTLTNSYWMFSPTINVEIPAYHMLCFRIGAGYHLTFGSNWTYDNNQDVQNAPASINGNSFFVQTGIFIGLFSF